jgi:hypothetical protein
MEYILKESADKDYFIKLLIKIGKISIMAA